MSGTAEGGSLAGRYAIEAELARGGMGAVFRARDLASNRWVALKRLTQAADAKHAHLFHREYHTLKQLQHPRIIEVYDYGADAEGPYYTMELLDGCDLRELAPLDFREACKHLRDVASSLALLHARRLLHRDVSGRNVRLTSDQRAKLLDFGGLTAFGVSSQIVGTPPLVAPEAMQGQALDQRTDLFALGGLAYHLLTGAHAYPAPTLQALPALWRRGPLAPPSSLVAGIPADLDELVLSLLSLDLLDRPLNAAEVIDRLNAIAGLTSDEALDVGRGYLSAPRLIGRDAELERLHRACERMIQGRGQAIAIEGEPGAGKTRMLEDACAVAQLGGATVLRVDAERDQGPYAVARGLISLLIASAPDLAGKLGAEHAGVLGAVLPGVRDAFPDVTPDKRSVDRNEQRVRVQRALAGWLEATAEQKPLLIAIDNAHACDEPSLALCASLARRAGSRALAVIVTFRVGEQPAAPRTWEALRHSALIVGLARLSAEQSALLARALFGEVDHCGRLGQWLHDRTDGNCMQLIALAAQLIADGQIRYRDGAWRLPAMLSGAGLPQGMADVLERRVARLERPARELAEAVSILRGRFTIAQCLALTGVASEQLFGWLDQLVNEGIVVAIDGDYQLAQRALAAYLLERLSPERKRELHQRAGELALASSSRDAASEIEAGWHLLRGGEELRGAEILARAGGRLVAEIEGLTLAAPGLEAAIEVFERNRCSKWMLLNALEVLTSAGWYVDRRYAVQHGERALALSLELTGLALAAKLERFIGKRAAFTVGTTFAALRHAFAKRGIEIPRFKSFKGAFAPLIGNVAIMIGVAANSFDARTARRFLHAARMMNGFPRDHMVSVMFDYARYYVSASEGRLAEAEPIGTRVLEWFKDGQNIKILGATSDEAARAISGGQMLGMALFNALGGRAEALEWAARLEGLGLSFYAMMADQARFVYHATRGELDQAAAHREQLELNAIAGGTTWQASLIIPMALAACHAISGDAVRLRRAVEDLEHSARDIPALEPVARMFRASHQVASGQAELALPELERLAGDELRPRAHLLWGFAHSARAQALLQLHRTGEALEHLERIAPDLGPYATQGAFMLGPVLVHARAQAAAGDRSGAAERLDRLIAEYEPYAVPLALALLHEARVEVANGLGDQEAAGMHAARFAMWARRTESPALIARCKRAARGRPEAEGYGSLAEPRTLDMTEHGAVSAVLSLLESRKGVERARAALRFMVESSGASRGYLLLGERASLRVAAHYPDGAPSPEETASEVIKALQSAEAASAHLDDEDAATAITEVEANAAGVLPGQLTVQALIADGSGSDAAKIVGAVALQLDAAHGTPLRRAMLSAIARSLCADASDAPIDAP